MTMDWGAQTAADSGTRLLRIVIRDSLLTPTSGTINFVFPNILMDSTFSPPLSDIETEDIIAAEGEFATGDNPVYDSPEDIIRALHEARETHRRQCGQV